MSGTFNQDPEWLLKKAKQEDGCDVSVGSSDSPVWRYTYNGETGKAWLFFGDELIAELYSRAGIFGPMIVKAMQNPPLKCYVIEGSK